MYVGCVCGLWMRVVGVGEVQAYEAWECVWQAYEVDECAVRVGR